MAAKASDRSDDLLAARGVAAGRALDGELVLLGIGEEVRDGGVDLDLVADGVLRRAGIGVVPDPRHPGRGLHRARITNPGLHPVRRQLGVDFRQDGPGFADGLEATSLVTRVTAGTLVGRVRDVQLLRLRLVHLLLVAFRARGLGHLRRQHRVVFLPFFFLFVSRGCVRGVAEAHRLAHAFVADGAANLIEWMR